MLLGQSRNNLDSKGRIFVPVKWRPDTSDHVVVLIGLNPADVKKEGSAYDLPLCIGILAANEQLSPEGLENFMMLGELSLDGSLVAVKGVLPIAINARSEGFKSIIVPLENANEAAVVEGIHVYGFSHIREVTDFLNGKQQAEPAQ